MSLHASANSVISILLHRHAVRLRGNALTSGMKENNLVKSSDLCIFYHMRKIILQTYTLSYSERPKCLPKSQSLTPNYARDLGRLWWDWANVLTCQTKICLDIQYEPNSNHKGRYLKTIILQKGML